MRCERCVNAGDEDGAEGVEKGSGGPKSNQHIHVCRPRPKSLVGGDVEAAPDAELHWSAEEDEEEVLEGNGPPQTDVEEAEEGEVIEGDGDEVGGESESSRAEEEGSPVLGLKLAGETRTLSLGRRNLLSSITQRLQHLQHNTRVNSRVELHRTDAASKRDRRFPHYRTSHQPLLDSVHTRPACYPLHSELLSLLFAGGLQQASRASQFLLQLLEEQMLVEGGGGSDRDCPGMAVD
mmetsp:Transcript_9126/g.20946  ORF Transcript_9126/g.20946 Transcript_9126/m.20946 type:complete len:236 (-) Transcript_9126:304-1011(-)